MPSLYNLAEKNLRRSYFYLTFFVVVVIFLGWAFSLVFNSQLILILAIILSFISAFASYWYSDKVVIALSGAKPVKKEENPELYRLVENLCITAGLPMPKLYIMEETQPNAFATGRNPKHSAIVVTRGLLNKLERTELEGVLAHELAHIGNRDILLSSMVVVLVGIVVYLADLFWRMLFWGGIYSRDRDSKAQALLLVLGLILAILAPILAQLIRFAISRRREFLADATGALLTRYPEGLARALEKIAQDQTPMQRASQATAHLFFANPFKGKQARSWLTNLFSTHPPIEERIKALRSMHI